MPRIKCPGCATILSIDDSQRGTPFPCSCGRLLRVPLPDQPAAPAVPLSPADKPDAISEQPKKTKPGKGETLPVRFDEEDSRAPADGPRPVRPKRKGRKRPESNNAAEWWEYYTGAVGIFGWVFIALVATWMLLMMITCVAPPLALVIMILGQGMITAGNLWILYVAFKDNPFYATLCLFTCLFTYAYIFMNLEETWRPALLVVLGALTVGSGAILFSALNVSVPGR